MIPPSRPSASWSQVVGSHGFSAERDAAPSLSFVRLLKGKISYSLVIGVKERLMETWNRYADLDVLAMQFYFSESKFVTSIRVANSGSRPLR